MPRPVADSPQLFALPDAPDFSEERRLARKGFAAIAGLDEAGRGPLAGPVVAAAVILNPASIPDGLDDSKRLSGARRAALFDVILAQARAVAIAALSAEAIDACDIRKASLEAMRRAAAGLCVVPDFALADGRDIPPGLACEARALVKGDQRSVSIAAASIIAKVTRDRMLVRCDSAAPLYGLGGHKGYACQSHLMAIAAHGGVARIHRFSFAPLRDRDRTRSPSPN
jgi:ribonuclease HII